MLPLFGPLIEIFSILLLAEKAISEQTITAKLSISGPKFAKVG